MEKLKPPTAPPAAPIKIDIWSDVQCAWCYIGKRRLEAATARFDGEVDIEYHSFDLAPDNPVEFDGATKEYMNRLRGVPLHGAEEALAGATAIAASVGLEYHFDRVQPTNTRLAHELIHFAKSKGRQLEMQERLFDAYFQRNEHVGRTPDLVEIAVELGFDRNEATAALAEHRFSSDVDADISRATALGIREVPFFVFDDRFGISGAQEADTLLRVLEQVAEEHEWSSAEGAEAR